MTDEQFVILEFNQASGMPRLAYEDIYDSRGDAEQDARELVAQANRVGRRERYAIASIDIEWWSDL